MTEPPAPGAGSAAATYQRLRRILRGLRHAPDRILHRWRRQRARAALLLHGAPTRVIFLCLGNVCRSPYGEYASRRLLAGEPHAPEFLSRGLIGPGRVPPEAATRVAAQHDVDMSGHLSRTLDPLDLLDGDVVFCMNPSQALRVREAAKQRRIAIVVLGDLDPNGIDQREIPDPWGKPDSEFEATYSRIDRILGAWLSDARTETTDHPAPGSDPERQ